MVEKYCWITIIHIEEMSTRISSFYYIKLTHTLEKSHVIKMIHLNKIFIYLKYIFFDKTFITL